MQEENTFEFVRTYPDEAARENYASLVGIDHIKTRLKSEASIILNPESIERWSQQHYHRQINLVKLFSKRPPLFIFTGDVGTGKTALAESFADEVAREEQIEVTLYKLSLNARGSGIVGEMTKLIGDSFEQLRKDALAKTGQKTALVLFIDEADALAQSREASQMHHEDKAGVNALIRGIDSLQGLPVPVLVVMCTNRHAAIDPAVRRRSAVTFAFDRPTREQCAALLKNYLGDVGLNEDVAAGIAEHCVPHGSLGYGYTYSDLTHKVLPAILLSAYPDRRIEYAAIMEVIKDTPPTAPFNEEVS
ncbi:MAG TPA: AAA family ATPase [Candidatus Saccharimonadales bacterium]|nr:AAA family ATPase [Candidatus Saccharimonadales bacterium]